jgi:uncharacterized protein YjbI with pentapeptide repeats
MDFTAESLPASIESLFRANNYTVERSVHLHGAEVDLVARPQADPFAPTIYIEATIERVGTTKYGKDLTKLVVVQREDPRAVRLIVSSSGFTSEVVERAKAAGIETQTYEDLFRSFEKVDPYVQEVRGTGTLGTELRKLNELYEEPSFNDSHGKTPATAWLSGWLVDDTQPNWLVIAGEYGTGKTALSRVLQFRWIDAYVRDPSRPIPLRIELRDFTRQFDAAGLIQHALRKSHLEHLPINYIWTLIQSGRMVLILDGYDEMAQYLSSKERRVCLEALAELSAGGARGLLFSRPNYFSEAEELALMDTLYRDLESRSRFSLPDVRALSAEEQALDSMLDQHFIERFERALQDLSPSETEHLIHRTLAGDPAGAKVVTDLLARVFRSDEEGATVSLSGKPVIISYVLDVVEQLKDEDAVQASGADLTEWDIYTLVLDQLMLRDWRQAGSVATGRRREFLQQLAFVLGQRDAPVVDEDGFKDLIAKHFRRDLARYDASARRSELETYFFDLRRSATLTRDLGPARDGWRFSHNSLREFLMTEGMVDSLMVGSAPLSRRVIVSDAMQNFAAAMPSEQLDRCQSRLTNLWAERHSNPSVGAYLQLLWPALIRKQSGGDRTGAAIRSISGTTVALDNLTLARMHLSTETSVTNLQGCSFENSSLSSIAFRQANLRNANFGMTILEGVDFSGSCLAGVKFTNALVLDCNFSDADVRDADFRQVDGDITILVRDSDDHGLSLSSRDALGYLAFQGALTLGLTQYEIMQHHPNFSIVQKICAKLFESSPRQRLGLEQKGASGRNVPFARNFVSLLESSGVAEVRGGRSDVLYLTPEGRAICGQLVETRIMPPAIAQFLSSNVA